MAAHLMSCACPKFTWNEIWLPLENLQGCDLPLRLKLKQVVDYDPQSALAGITDAALVALVSNPPHGKVWSPPLIHSSTINPAP